MPVATALRSSADALKLSPQEVAQMTRETFAAHSGLAAIYFQGALLDPLPILDQLEIELRVPIVASSLARMWDNSFAARSELQDTGLRQPRR